MAYLSSPTSITDYGVVKIGNYIDVVDGIISLEQDVGPNANVKFDSVSVNSTLEVNGNLVVTSVTPSSGDGIALSNVVTSGYDAKFKITNTGVLSLTAGPGISLTANTGNITISSTGADLINVYGTTTSYTATLDDEYIGVFSANAVTITLPAGVDGRVYTIKDEYGQGSRKITIQSAVGETIDNKPNYVISIPSQSVSVVSRAAKWFII
jgi:hypothetical protein